MEPRAAARFVGVTDGSRPVERDDGERGGERRWWWLAVAAIALVVAVVLVRGGGEEEGGPGAVGGTPSLEPADPGQAQEGSVTFGGEPAGPILTGGAVSRHAGEEALGTLVPVDSVIAEGVYWVGEGREGFLLVEPEGVESQVAPGDLVTFRGTVRALDDAIRSAVWGAEAEVRVEAQGGYVAVDELATTRP